MLADDAVSLTINKIMKPQYGHKLHHRLRLIENIGVQEHQYQQFKTLRHAVGMPKHTEGMPKVGMKNTDSLYQNRFDA